MNDEDKKKSEEIADADLDDVTGGGLLSTSTFQRTTTLVNTTEDANTADHTFSPDVLDAGQTPPLSFSVDLEKKTR